MHYINELFSKPIFGMMTLPMANKKMRAVHKCDFESERKLDEKTRFEWGKVLSVERILCRVYFQATIIWYWSFTSFIKLGKLPTPNVAEQIKSLAPSCVSRQCLFINPTSKNLLTLPCPSNQCYYNAAEMSSIPTVLPVRNRSITSHLSDSP